MPLNPNHFDRIGNSSEGSFSLYHYVTTDSLSEVLSAGYFNESRFFNTDGWPLARIDCNCADGLYQLQVDNSGFLVSNASVPSELASFAGKASIWWGDSTTEQLAGLGFVGYDGANGLSKYSRQMATSKTYNHGKNGYTLALAMAGGVENNDGGNNCTIDGVLSFAAANQASQYFICFGINDCRNDASIAGSTYGDSAQLAKAAELQGYLVIAAQQIKSADPAGQIIFRMPNGHYSASTYFENGVTGQNCMDIHRLVYRGDSSLSVNSIDTLVNGSLMFDTLRAVYSDLVNEVTALVNADGLHPSLEGYEYIVTALLREFSSVYEQDSTYHADTRLTPENLNGDQFIVVDDAGAVESAQPTYFDLSFSNTANAWGDANGTDYGATSTPAYLLGDIILLTKLTGETLILQTKRMADSRNGGYLRWYSGGPEGYYPGDDWEGAAATVYRHKFAFSDRAREANRRAGLAISTAIIQTVGANPVNTSTIDLQIPLGSGISDILSTGSLCSIGAGGNNYASGIPLSGATITQNAGVGSWRIVLTGVDFTKSVTGAAAIVRA